MILSPSRTEYGTQRSLDIQILTDPTIKELYTSIVPFLSSQTTSTTPPHPLFPPPPSNIQNYKTIVVQIAFASDASVVAVAQAHVYSLGGKTTCDIKTVLVHGSHRRNGYGLLVVQELLATTAKCHGAVIAVVNLLPETVMISSKLFRSADFDLTGDTASRYLNATSPVKGRRTQAWSAEPNQSIRGNRTSAGKDTKHKSGTWSNEMSIEYWAGGARKIFNVGLPSFHHARTMIDNTEDSNNACSVQPSQLPHVPIEVAKHLCAMKRIDPNQRVTLSLSELVSYKLSQQWWLDVQLPQTEFHVVQQAQQMMKKLSSSAQEEQPRQLQQLQQPQQPQQPQQSQQPSLHQFSSTKELPGMEKRIGTTKNSTSTIEDQNATIRDLKEQLRVNELSLRKATMLLKVKDKQFVQRQPRKEMQPMQQPQSISSGDLSFQISGTRISNRGKNYAASKTKTGRGNRYNNRPVEGEENGNDTKSNGRATISPMRAMAAKHKKKIEGALDGAALQKKGGIRLDFVDDGGGGKNKKHRERSPMRGFLEKSAYSRPFDKVNRSSLPPSLPKMKQDKKIQPPSIEPVPVPGVEHSSPLPRTPEKQLLTKSTISRLSEEQLQRARSRVATMLKEEKNRLNNQEHIVVPDDAVLHE